MLHMLSLSSPLIDYNCVMDRHLLQLSLTALSYLCLTSGVLYIQCRWLIDVFSMQNCLLVHNLMNKISAVA